MIKKTANYNGFTMVELILVIVIIGILAGVATMKLAPSLETAEYEATKAEMRYLAYAIVGNPDVYTDGARTNFGYVGDIGALPPNLTALVTNPGGYATWNGPYIGAGINGDDYSKDAWGTNYTLSDTLIRSTGSGSNIDKILAVSSASLLSNTVTGFLRDAGGSVPSSTYSDSLQIILVHPDGSGGLDSTSINPNGNGNFSFSNVSIGNHTISIIYTPDSDTTCYSITVCPNRDVMLDIVFPADLW